METRVSRALTQRLFLIKSTFVNKHHYDFIILGSTGNAYTVSIKMPAPSCTCPDNKLRHRTCKHIYFVLIKVLKHTHIDNKINDNNLDQLFCNMNINDDVVADESIVKAFDEKIKKIVIEPKGKDDICPICFEDIDDGTEIDYCKHKCGRYIHVECFKMWTSKNAATCVFCRCNWFQNNNEYINLTKN